MILVPKYVVRCGQFPPAPACELGKRGLVVWAVSRVSHREALLGPASHTELHPYTCRFTPGIHRMANGLR